MFKSRWSPLPLLLLLGLWAAPTAQAIDDVRIIGGESDNNDDASLWRIVLTDRWNQEWQADGWVVGGYSELTLGYWQSGEKHSDDDSLYELALTPVFRLYRSGAERLGPFIDAGLGVHLLSQEDLGNKQLGSQIHFGTHLGGGYQWRNTELTLRVQHISNAGLGSPNPGINFLLVGLGFRL